MLKDPTNEQTLVAALRYPWDFHCQKKMKPFAMETLELPQLGMVSTAAGAIADCLVRFSQKKGTFIDSFQFNKNVYPKFKFPFAFEYVARPEFVSAVERCESYITNLANKLETPVHATETHYFYIGGASGSGKTRMAFELAQHLCRSNSYDCIYTFIDGQSLPYLSEDVTDHNSFTASIFLSALTSNQNIEFDVSIEEIISKIDRDGFSQVMDKTKVLYVHNDECQLATYQCRAILRTIRNLTCNGQLSFVIVPVLSGISALDIMTRDLVEVSGMKPFEYSLAGIESPELTKELMKYLGISEQEPCGALSMALLDLGGLPRLVEYAANILKTCGYDAETFNIDAAQELDNQIVLKYQEAYPSATWLGRFKTSSNIRTFLTLAIAGTYLSPDFIVYGSTLKQCQDSGLFSLKYSSNNEVCQIFLPLVVVRYLNSQFQHQLCKPELLDPFNSEWSSFEAISIQSLWFRIKALKIGYQDTVKISDLRPGCLGSPSTLNTIIDISEELPRITRLARHITNINDTCVSTGSDGNGGNISLSEGFQLIRCCENQTALDGILISSKSKLRLFTQSKSSRLLKNDGSPSSVTMYLGYIDDVCKQIEPFRHIDDFNDIIEVFTDHSSNISIADIPESTIVISRENWKAAVGPVFAQRLRIRELEPLT